jgi:hypothetical protein
MSKLYFGHIREGEDGAKNLVRLTGHRHTRGLAVWKDSNGRLISGRAPDH